MFIELPITVPLQFFHSKDHAVEGWLDTVTTTAAVASVVVWQTLVLVVWAWMSLKAAILTALVLKQLFASVILTP
jgi:uncharacterized membrane protein